MNQYNRNECVVFKSRETATGLSNLSLGFPLRVNKLLIPSAESLYQATKYADHTDIQREILNINNPLKARVVSRKYQSEIRKDWAEIKEQVMEWCLHLKLAQHWMGFGEILIKTGNRPIVEQSSNSPFWGAMPSRKIEDMFEGENRLGNILTRLRDDYSNDTTDRIALSPLRVVNPPDINNLLILGQPVSQWRPGKPVDRRTLSLPVQWTSAYGAHQLQ